MKTANPNTIKDRAILNRTRRALLNAIRDGRIEVEERNAETDSYVFARFTNSGNKLLIYIC